MAVRIKKPTVLRSLPLDRHAVIEASAGTGKTYTLEHLVIELLLTTDVTLDRLLVVTFTEKAAAELRTRLRRKMTTMLEATADDAQPGDDMWILDDTARQKLARALLSFDAASIQTIHAFCQRVLQENAFESGRLFDQELVDGLATFERAFYAVLRTDIAHRDEERVFLDAWLSNNRLQELVRLLWEAHTRRGAFHPVLDVPAIEQMLRTLTKMELTPHTLRPAMLRARMHPSTVHATLERVASLRRTLVEYQTDDDLPRALVALQGIPQVVAEKLEPVVTEEGKLHELAVAMRSLADHLVGFESAVCQRFLPLVEANLQREKAKRGQLDFDDMLGLLAESLDGPSGPALVETLQARFSFALIDEFQDTDEIQWSIFSKVFLESKGRSILYVIGDPKQAIYGFRGADVHTYLAARAHIDTIGGSLVHLTESFRATPRMIEAQNLILDDEADQPLFTGAIRYDHPVTCGALQRVGLTRDGHALTPVHISELVPRDDTFQKTMHARRTLADRYAREIVTLLDPARTQFVAEETTPIGADEIFILTRSTKEGVEVADALRKYDVPHAFFKQDGLFQTQEAHDVRDLLAAIADPLHQSRRLRAWQSPFFAVPLEALPNLRDLAGSHRLMKLLLEWKTLADEKRFERLYSNVLEETGLIERELFLSASERALTNYLHIFEVLLDVMQTSRATLPELIHTLGAFIQGRRSPPGEDGNIQRVESERRSVKIMTMHKAKGLEATVVFLYGGFDEPFGRVMVHHVDGERRLHVGAPRPPSVAEEADEENQRLLYVAMTRAKARLYLPYFGTKTGSDGQTVSVIKRLGGAHRQLNDRLDQIVAHGYDASLFEKESVDELDRRQPKTTSEERKPGALSGWAPPPDLLRPIVAPPAFEQLRSKHLGFDVTSYSRIKAEKGGYRPPEGLLEDEIAFDVDGIPSAADDVLPSGPAIGRFLHEMVELVPLAAVENAASVAFFGANAEVKTIFTDGMIRYDVDPRHYDEAVRLVYTALLGPITLGGSAPLSGVVAADRVVREMEFLYPYGEPRPVGFVKGFIDLVVEHDGKVYVLDWKSDLLPNYDAATIDRHVEQNYRLQAQLYALAIVKLFGLDDETTFDAKFGGAIYCFLRGMALDGDGRRGVFFDRPSFAALAQYQKELMP